MSEAQVYAVVTCTAGIILLLGWLYVTTGNPRSTRLLLKSVLIFVVPVMVLVTLSGSFQFTPALWLVALIEESLKATAAATEKTSRIDRFLLVALFGIWELTWVKPLWGLNHAAALDGWNGLQLAGLTAAGVVTVLMHGVTAEIYAFRFAGRLPLALIVSWIVHAAFNASVGILGVSFVASLLQLLPLLLLFLALWPTNLPLATLERG
jgi:hypothetical protein